MNANQLWEQLLAEGYAPVKNQIELHSPLRVRCGDKEYTIAGVYRLNNGECALVKARSKYYGRLAN